MKKPLTDELLIERRAIEKSARMHWFHWLIVIASLVLTLSAWYISKQSIDEKIALQFDRQAKQLVELVSERMKKYEDGLWGGVSAIQTNGGDISYKDWKTFSHSLRIEDKYPGINGIGVIHYVAPEKMDAYLAEQRKDRPDYALHPTHQKNEFWPITYIEPVETNAKAVGLDMAHEKNRYTAALKARDTGKAQITGPIVLVQDKEKTPGFLFYAPFYRGGIYNTKEERREHFTGMVYAPFVVKKLMEGTLQKEKRRVSIKIMDGEEVLYDEHIKENTDYDTNHLYSKRFELDLYGRNWVFDVRSTKSFREATENNQPMLILIGGIIIDTLLLTLFILLANSNQRAVRFIHKITEE